MRVAVLVAAVALLVGCGDDGTPAPAASPTAATSAAPAQAPAGTPAPSQEPSETPAPDPAGGAESFVATVRAQVPDVAAGRSDAEIAAIATTACRGLAAGDSADDITAAAQSLGTLDAEATDQATARELVKLAIDTSCPDQAPRVDEF